MQLVQKLELAEFDENDSALGQVVEALLSLESLVRSWGFKTSRHKFLQFNLRGGCSTALTFEKEFVACSALVDKACEVLVLAVSVESFAGICALRNELPESAAARQAEFASTVSALKLQEQSLEELQGSVAALKEESRAAGARVETLLEELTRDLKASIAAEVQKGVTGAAVGSAAQLVASAGARKAAEELGVDAQALELHLLNSVPALLLAVASESESTRAAVAKSQAEIEAAVERVRRSLQSQLAEVLTRLPGGLLRLPTDGLEPALVAFLIKEGLSQLGGFFLRCQVLSLHSLALVPESDMHELGLMPLQAARVAAVMKMEHPSCPLWLNLNGDESDVATDAITPPPPPPLRLTPVLNLENMNPLLKEVLENPGKEFGLLQSLEVVLELVKAGAEQAVKLSGLSTVMVLGVTGIKYIRNSKSFFVRFYLSVCQC